MKASHKDAKAQINSLTEFNMVIVPEQIFHIDG